MRALPFITVLPSVTWPSPPMATAPLRRTARIVVPCGLNVFRHASLEPSRRYGLAFRPRVGSVVGAGQVGEIKVGVDLRRGDVRVAEQLLHAAQILTRFKQMRRERMPEQVRVDVRPAGPCAAPSTRCAAGRRGASGACRSCRRTAPSRPSPASVGALLRARRAAPRRPCRPTGTMRVFEPLPSTRTVRSAEIDVAEVEADQFGEPQARRNRRAP